MSEVPLYITEDAFEWVPGTGQKVRAASARRGDTLKRIQPQGHGQKSAFLAFTSKPRPEIGLDCIIRANVDNPLSLSETSSQMMTSSSGSPAPARRFVLLPREEGTTWPGLSYTFRVGQLQGNLVHKKHRPSRDPAVGPCLGPYGVPSGGGTFL